MMCRVELASDLVRFASGKGKSMHSMASYTKAAMERATKVQEVNFAGHGQEDRMVASGGDYRHQRPAHATLAGALRGVWLSGAV